MGQLGLPELLIIGAIALLVFGPKKLPDLGRGLGKAMHDFKASLNGTAAEENKEAEPASHATPAKTEPK